MHWSSGFVHVKSFGCQLPTPPNPAPVSKHPNNPTATATYPIFNPNQYPEELLFCTELLFVVILYVSLYIFCMSFFSSSLCYWLAATGDCGTLSTFKCLSSLFPRLQKNMGTGQFKNFNQYFSFRPNICYYFNDPKFSDRQVWANSVNPDRSSLIRVLTVCYFGYIFWTHFSMVKLSCIFENSAFIGTPGKTSKILLSCLDILITF